ncbi:MAG: succinate dehydrogenase/fumarate reductase iron-sulfur subunit [Candidatus Methanofastidiosia archaeon]
MRFKIFRFNPEKDEKPYFKTYDLEIEEGMTVLDALNEIKWRMDGTLSYRKSCRSAICGSCAMVVNGKYVLACNTQLLNLKSKKIKIEPLTNFPIIKDLIVDLSEFFEKYERIKPYLTAPNPPKKERIQTPAEFKKIDEYVMCIMCSACYAACPSVWWRRDFLGPAALTKVYRFYADTRDEEKLERLEIADSLEGAWGCRIMFRCEEACPKKIGTTYAIQQLKKSVSKKVILRR